MKTEQTSGIIELRITLPVSFTGKIATANTLIKGANISCRLGGKDAVPTWMRKRIDSDRP